MIGARGKARPWRLALGLIAVSIGTQASAGIFDDAEARRALEALRTETQTRLQKLEAGQRAQLELFTQLEELKSDIAKLRGKLEVLSFELEAAQKRQRDFYVDLDNRLRKQELDQQELAGKVASASAAAQSASSAATSAASLAAQATRQVSTLSSNMGGTPAAPAATSTTAAAIPTSATAPIAPVSAVAADAEGPSEARDFEAALNLFKGAKYAEAASALQAFMKTHPASASLPSATYWTASALYQAREPGRAAEFYQRLITRWPDDSRSPDAMLGLANCQAEMGEAALSKKTIARLLARFPKSNAADIARQQQKKKK